MKRKSRNLTLISNAVIFPFKNVPEEKFNNYRLMTTQGFNTKDFRTKGFPYKLQIEPTNTCNLSCPLCPVGNNTIGRKPRHMSFEEFKALIDDMGNYLLLLILWDWGEPFLNPSLPAMIRYAYERGIKTITSTNAHFLHDEEYVGRILTSGLTNLIVAIDSLDKEQYRIYRKRGDLNKALSGLETLLAIKRELKSETLINLRMVIMKQNEGDVDRMRSLAREQGVDIFTLKTVNPSCGLTAMDADIIPDNPHYRRYRYRSGTYERIRIERHCRRIWHMSNIFSDGSVVPCCYDFTGELRVGNINLAPFSTIWNSPAYKQLRERVYYSKDSIPKCSECVINYKYSMRGEYPEVLYLSAGPLIRAENFAIDTLRKYYDIYPTAQQLVTFIKKIRYSV